MVVAKVLPFITVHPRYCNLLGKYPHADVYIVQCADQLSQTNVCDGTDVTFHMTERADSVRMIKPPQPGDKTTEIFLFFMFVYFLGETNRRESEIDEKERER